MEYFDTSVLVPYYCPERLSIAAESAMLTSSNRIISKLSEIEFVSALSLKMRAGGLDVTAARTAQSKFNLHLASGYYRSLPLQTREFELARD